MSFKFLAFYCQKGPNLLCIIDRYIKHVPIRTVEYKSQYCIDTLYPDTVDRDSPRQTLKISSISKVSGANEHDFDGFIPIDELKITHSRSSGPGGQNVNKVNTKVEIRFHVDSAKWIPEILKPKLMQVESSRITKDGYLVIRSEKTRSQILNQADCLDRLRAMIRACDVTPYTPSPEDVELIKRRQSKARASILREKKHHSIKKQTRNAPSSSEL